MQYFQSADFQSLQMYEVTYNLLLIYLQDSTAFLISNCTTHVYTFYLFGPCICTCPSYICSCLAPYPPSYRQNCDKALRFLVSLVIKNQPIVSFQGQFKFSWDRVTSFESLLRIFTVCVAIRHGVILRSCKEVNIQIQA